MLSDAAGTQTQGIIFPYEIKIRLKGAPCRKRPEIGRAVRDYAPCLVDTRKILIGYFYHGIALAVFEQNVVMRVMTLDQVVENGFSVPDDILSRWPAALTAIVFGPDGKTHAIRVPADSFVQDVLAISGPIFSTSVNFSGEKSLLTFDDILPVFSDSVDFIVNAPLIKGGMASTLVDATSSPYKVLRQGSYII